MAQLACTRLTHRLGSCFVPHMGDGHLIVLEGAARSGKTTSLLRLSKMLGAVMVPQLDHTMEQSLIPYDKVQQWYILAELARQRFIQTTLNRSSDVVQDRNIISTLAFSYASARRSGSGQRFTTILKMMLRISHGMLVRPDILVVLTVDPVVGLLRRPRSRIDKTDHAWPDDSFLRYHAAFYQELICTSLADYVTKIDTTALTPDGTFEAVARAIQERLKSR